MNSLRIDYARWLVSIILVLYVVDDKFIMSDKLLILDCTEFVQVKKQTRRSRNRSWKKTDIFHVVYMHIIIQYLKKPIEKTIKN